MNKSVDLHGKKYYAKKRFGQNFLTDTNIIESIVEIANIDSNTIIIEIGPGTGALTKQLLLYAKKVISYEIDNELSEYLNDKFGSNDKFELINDDFLKRNFIDDIGDRRNLKIKVVANLPYYITTPILLKLLDQYEYLDEIIIMTQLEVANRLSSLPNNKDYGSLSVFVQSLGKVTNELFVPRTVFIPVPKVDSAVVKIVIDPIEVIKDNIKDKYYQLIRASFKQKRKTLLNNLNQEYSSMSKEEIKNILLNIFHNENIRAEQLSISDFTKLLRVLVDKL